MSGRRATINNSISTTRRENYQQQQQPMKVVHIKTQYVETDATSFKSVVQNLTGKDSTIPESPTRNYSYSNYNSNSNSTTMAMKVKKRDRNQRVSDGGGVGVGGGYGGGGGGGFNKFLSRELSFDRLFKELPSVDELHKLFNL